MTLAWSDPWAHADLHAVPCVTRVSFSDPPGPCRPTRCPVHHMCLLFGLNAAHPPFLSRALIWPWGLPSSPSLGSPGPTWKPVVSPSSGLAGRLQAGGQSWPCSEARAGWPAVEFESVLTLARLGLTAA